MTTKAKLAITAAVIAVVLLAAVLIVFCPRSGGAKTEFWSPLDEYSSAEVAKVQKTAGEDFVILLFTDIQLWSFAWDNSKTYEIMDELVGRVDPDLIILPGDNVSGLGTDFLTRSLVRKMESYGVPWAPVFGNHDAEGNATLLWQADKFEAAEHCLFDRGPANMYGVGNYFVNIFEGDEPVYSLCLMDNGRYTDYGGDIGSSEIWVDFAQIEWYKWNVDGLAAEYGARVPSMTFSHFAYPEMRDAVEKYAVEGEDGRLYIPEEYGGGSCAYEPCAPDLNSGLFDVAKTSGLTHAFFGHDHENDAYVYVDGVRLGYGLKTGPSPAFWNDATEYGGTVIAIGEGGVDVRNEVICEAN